MKELLGKRVVGSGTNQAIVLNDWLSDTSSWAMTEPFIDCDRFSWAFADLRGYGRSRAIGGRYTLAEASADVIRLADSMGWERFAVIGHSMSSLVALQLGQSMPQRVARVVVLTPPPPCGFGADDAVLTFLRSLALGSDADRVSGFEAMWGSRLGLGWRSFKARQWRDAAAPAAAAAYVDMFASSGMPDPSAPISVPVMAITGEQDAEVMREASVRTLLSRICDDLTVRPLADCGHYPMQECPPLTYSHIEQFLG